MNTDTHADRFETRLLAAILSDYPDLSNLQAPSGRRQSNGPACPERARRRGGRVLLVGVGVGVVAAVAAGVASAGHIAPARTAGPARLSADYVVDHFRAAVQARTSSDIQYELGRTPNSQTGVLENTATWVYGNSTREISLSQDLDADGRPVLGYLMAVTRHKTVTITINYQSHTWSTTTYPWGLATPANTPGPKPETIHQTSQALWRAVKAGSITDIGPADIDGQRAIHLVQGSAKAGEINMWVNPATYLPIRVIETAPGESAASSRAIREDFKWLAGTPANMRLLTPAGAVPAGFTQVPDAGVGN